MKLCREIKNDKPLASHIATLIKECVFSGWVFDEENQTEEAALAALLSLVRKAIQKMPELESIKLENCSVSNAVVKLVCQAPGLRSLHLYQCRLTSLVDDKIWDKLTSTRIDHLTLIDLQDEANEIESGSLISHIPLQHLVSLRTNYCAVLDNLTGPTNHLQRLEITEYRYSMDGLVALADAIGRLSLLTHLSIHRLTKVTLALNDSPGPSMPTHFTVIFLPSLRSLLCPGSIAAAILSPAPNSLMHLDLTGKHVIESTFSNVHTPWCFPTLDNVHVDGLEELVLPTHGMIKGAFPFNHPHPLLRKLTIIREDLGKQSFALSCIVVCPCVVILDAKCSCCLRFCKLYALYLKLPTSPHLSRYRSFRDPNCDGFWICPHSVTRSSVCPHCSPHCVKYNLKSAFAGLSLKGAGNPLSSSRRR